MAFFDIQHGAHSIVWKLSQGDRKFHFILFKIYSIFLILLGVVVTFILLNEGDYAFLWLAGLLPVIPGVIMLLTRYPLQLVFSKGEITVLRRNRFSGTAETRYTLHDFPIFYTEYNYGKYGGQEFGLIDGRGKMHRLAKVPWTRLKKVKTIRELKESADFAGFEFRELPNTLRF